MNREAATHSPHLVRHQHASTQYIVLLNTVRREGESQGTSRLLLRQPPPPFSRASHHRTQATQHTFHPSSRTCDRDMIRRCYNLGDADTHQKRRLSMPNTTGPLENGIHKKKQRAWYILTYKTNSNEVTSFDQHFVNRP